MNLFISHNSKDQLEVDNLSRVIIDSNVILNEYAEAQKKAGLYSAECIGSIHSGSCFVPHSCHIAGSHHTLINDVALVNGRTPSCLIFSADASDSYVNSFNRVASVNSWSPVHGTASIDGCNPLNGIASVNGCISANGFASVIGSAPCCIIFGAGISGIWQTSINSIMGLTAAGPQFGTCVAPAASYDSGFPSFYLDHLRQEKLHTKVSAFYETIRKSGIAELRNLAAEIKPQLDQSTDFSLFYAVELLQKFEKKEKGKLHNSLCCVKYLRFRLFGKFRRDIRRGYRNIVRFFFKNMDDNSGADANKLFGANAHGKQLLVNQQMNYNDAQRNYRVYRAIAA